MVDGDVDDDTGGCDSGGGGGVERGDDVDLCASCGSDDLCFLLMCRVRFDRLTKCTSHISHRKGWMKKEKT